MPRSALGALTEAIRAYFDANAISARVEFGLRARSEQINQGPGGASRVVIIPGKYSGELAPKGLDGGRFAAPMHTHARPEPNELLDDDNLATLSVWGVDASSPLAIRSELAQYEATQRLLEQTVQAIHGSPIGGPEGCWPAIVWTGKYWPKPPVEMSFGLELLVWLEIHGPLFDAPIGFVTPGFTLTRDGFGVIPQST